VLARHIFVTFGDVDASVSDNYFDLIPNQPVTVTVSSSAGVGQLKQNLSIKHLMQAFLHSGAQ
jgi:beta-mannosidase